MRKLLFYSFYFQYIMLFGQVNVSPNGTEAKCPDQWIIYTADNTHPAGCQYDWTVTNGQIQGGYQSGSNWKFEGGSLVNIRWNNSTSPGVINLQVTNCDDNNGIGSTGDVSIPILTLQGVTPGTITGPSSVPANNTNNRVYEEPLINFPNRGSGDPNPYEVDDYEWDLPNGWTIDKWRRH